MALSSSYFVTVRPASGFVVDEALEELERWLSSTALAFVGAFEKAGHAKHLHVVFITGAPRRRDSVRRSVYTIMRRFFAPGKFQLDVRVALTPGVEDYVRKDGDIVLRLNEDRIYAFITDDVARSREVVEENRQFKETAILFAYDNKETWFPFFRSFGATGVDTWLRSIVQLGGKLPTNRLTAAAFYDFYVNGKSLENAGHYAAVEAFRELAIHSSRSKKRKASSSLQAHLSSSSSKRSHREGDSSEDGDLSDSD